MLNETDQELFLVFEAAMLVFLKNGLYEGGITFKGKDLDYSYCKEEAIRLGTLIWERLAD